MEKEIKTFFTEEEISKYIEELNAAIGNKRKVNKLLDLSHLPILVAYLRQIGVSEELLSLAAVSEFTRYKMREVLSDKTLKQCKVTDTGVIFEKNKKYSRVEKIGVDEFNVFWLGEEKYFGRQEVREDEDGNKIRPRDPYMRLQRKMYYYKDPDRPINCYGWALCRRARGGGFYLIDDVDRKKDGLIYYRTIKCDTDNSFSYKLRIYAGEAIEVEENENTFREHYDIYSALFPKYKDWLDKRYLRGAENFEEVAKRTDSAIFKDRIEKLTKRNPMLKDKIEYEINRYIENKRKFDELYGFLDKYECEAKEGKDVIDDIKSIVETRESINIEECQKNVEEFGRVEKEELDDDNLEYQSLKERAETLGENKESLEEMLEMLKNVNFSNEKLIEIVEEKIRNIVKTKDVKEENKLSEEKELEL